MYYYPGAGGGCVAIEVGVLPAGRRIDKEQKIRGPKFKRVVLSCAGYFIRRHSRDEKPYIAFLPVSSQTLWESSCIVGCAWVQRYATGNPASLTSFGRCARRCSNAVMIVSGPR